MVLITRHCSKDADLLGNLLISFLLALSVESTCVMHVVGNLIAARYLRTTF